MRPAGAGLVIGLAAPLAPGGDRRRRRRRRTGGQLHSATAWRAGVGDKLYDALPPGSAGIISIYDHDAADTVAGALANAIRTSTAQIDKASADKLKAGLNQASVGLTG